MLTKNEIKLIASLQQKKHRVNQGLFTVEGKKATNEFLSSRLQLHQVYATIPDPMYPQDKLTLVSEAELKKISALTTPQQVLAVFEIPKARSVSKDDLIVALDAVRDPGNLGTMIRLCDWFGIEQVVCSETTVDCYNPKVVQASMGSLSRVNVNYVDLKEFLHKTPLKKFGAFMDGASVYSTDLPERGVLVMGNEANGISKDLETFIDHRISIPSFSTHQSTESLNVATATAILLSEFRRRTI